MKNIFVFSFWVLLNTCLFAQSRGEIKCEERTSIPLWENPGSMVVLRQLSCGQSIFILSLDDGYIKAQTSENLFGYVEAQYVQPLGNRIEVGSAAKDPYQKSVRLPQTQEQQIPQPDNQSRIAIQPPLPAPPPPASTQKAGKFGKNDQEKPRRHEAGLYFDVSHIRYEESSLDMKEGGTMWGVSGDYIYRPEHFMLKVDARFSLGSVDYSSPSGEFDNLRDYNFETRFIFGHDLLASGKGHITPFSGFGYRSLFDDLASAGPGGYDRKSNYLYSPIGLDSTIRLGKGWSLGATGEYDLFWHGWQYSGSGDFTAKNDQNSGWGTRASIRIAQHTGRTEFCVEPFFRYWSIEQSDLVGIPGIISIWEPANSSTEWGTRIGIRF